MPADVRLCGERTPAGGRATSCGDGGTRHRPHRPLRRRACCRLRSLVPAIEAVVPRLQLDPHGACSEAFVCAVAVPAPAHTLRIASLSGAVACFHFAIHLLFTGRDGSREAKASLIPSCPTPSRQRLRPSASRNHRGASTTQPAAPSTLGPVPPLWGPPPACAVDQLAAQADGGATVDRGRSLSLLVVLASRARHSDRGRLRAPPRPGGMRHGGCRFSPERLRPPRRRTASCS